MQLIPPDALDLAARAVENGELVAVPTDRWYMLCADATNPRACQRIFSSKHRPQAKPLVLVLPDQSDPDGWFTLTLSARALASAFWPGHLALILPWRNSAVGQQHASVGTPHALVTKDPGVLGALAAAATVPIAATTASDSNRPPEDPGPAIAPDGVQRFAERAGLDLAYCIDGGICPQADHLTVIDCTAETPTTVRSGLVHDRAIHTALAGLSTRTIRSEPAQGDHP